MNSESFKQTIRAYAEMKGYKLSPMADKIMDRTIKCQGLCPCDTTRGLCPCGYHQQEIEKDGHCHCHLFIKE